MHITGMVTTRGYSIYLPAGSIKLSTPGCGQRCIFSPEGTFYAMKYLSTYIHHSIFLRGFKELVTGGLAVDKMSNTA